MNVRFEATIDECVDLHLRVLARSNVARMWPWTGAISTGIVSGVLVYLLIEDAAAKWIMASLCGIGAAIAYPLVYRNTVRRRIRKMLQERLGANSSLPVEVEISADGIRTTQLTTEILFRWPSIEAIDETPDAVIFLESHGGMAMVRKRAFTSTEAFDEFVRESRRFLSNCEKAGATDGA